MIELPIKRKEKSHLKERYRSFLHNICLISISNKVTDGTTKKSFVLNIERTHSMINVQRNFSLMY